MDACDRTSACPCARPAGAGTLGTLLEPVDVLLHSRLGHVRRVLRTVIAASGIEVRGSGDHVVVSSDDWPATEAALVAADLTAPELREIRVARGGADDVDALLGASTLADLLARKEHDRLRQLLLSEAFCSHYQPIVDLATGRVVAHEALLRLATPEDGLTPDRLFAMAAEAGWTDSLDRIGREAALTGAAGWLGQADLFINFVPTSIYRPEHCLRTTWAAAHRAGIDPSRIVFELTESTDADAEHLARVLRYYRSQGCRIAVDDVGAGFGSLNRIAQVEPEVVKIDRELVQGESDSSAAVIRAVASLCEDVGATLLAEGVETAEQAEAMRDLGVELAQGWYFGRPQPPPAPGSSGSGRAVAAGASASGVGDRSP